MHHVGLYWLLQQASVASFSSTRLFGQNQNILLFNHAFLQGQDGLNEYESGKKKKEQAPTCRKCACPKWALSLRARGVVVQVRYTAKLTYLKWQSYTRFTTSDIEYISLVKYVIYKLFFNFQWKPKDRFLATSLGWRVGKDWMDFDRRC